MSFQSQLVLTVMLGIIALAASVATLVVKTVYITRHVRLITAVLCFVAAVACYQFAPQVTATEFFDNATLVFLLLGVLWIIWSRYTPARPSESPTS